jgi:pyruvate/2-oxoglutarate dehydrogenase complex dihydrolipoamide acyltransferase (E2) component
VTPRPSTRSPRARRAIALVAAVTLVALTSLLVITTSPAQDADARTSAATTKQPALVAQGELMLVAEVSRAHEAAEQAQEARAAAAAAAEAAAAEAAAAEQVRRFLEGAVAAEAARVAAEQAAAAEAQKAAEAGRSAMGGGWAALRRCESGGNYRAVSASGAYRGAYQFSRSTWNAVASRSHPHLVGVDPAAASPADQDAMALALYRSSGARPWPHCGKHL